MADTHVHTVYSPDAEGELDEFVHFARDQAGLDILTLIDNDYYPHKALTEPEWQIHQALADHFTEKGKFIWMPGYEFTYHRRPHSSLEYVTPAEFAASFAEPPLPSSSANDGFDSPDSHNRWYIFWGQAKTSMAS